MSLREDVYHIVEQNVNSWDDELLLHELKYHIDKCNEGDSNLLREMIIEVSRAVIAKRGLKEPT